MLAEEYDAVRVDAVREFEAEHHNWLIRLFRKVTFDRDVHIIYQILPGPQMRTEFSNGFLIGGLVCCFDEQCNLCLGNITNIYRIISVKSNV